MGRWQAIFSQESWRIARKNCAVQGAKDPLIGHVANFQTSPKARHMAKQYSKESCDEFIIFDVLRIKKP